jgi:hypothetical protein
MVRTRESPRSVKKERRAVPLAWLPRGEPSRAAQRAEDAHRIGSTRLATFAASRLRCCNAAKSTDGSCPEDVAVPSCRRCTRRQSRFLRGAVDRLDAAKGLLVLSGSSAKAASRGAISRCTARNSGSFSAVPQTLHVGKGAPAVLERGQGVFEGGRLRVVGDGVDLPAGLHHRRLQGGPEVLHLDPIEGRHAPVGTGPGLEETASGSGTEGREQPSPGRDAPGSQARVTASARVSLRGHRRE